MAVADTFAAIKSLLRSDRVEPCTSATLRIEEKHKSAKMKLAMIASVGASAFSIKYDLCAFPGQTLFAIHPSIHRACDAIAFCEVEGTPFILCFELKSSEPTRHEVTEQFRSAHCFLEYLDVLLKNYCPGKSIEGWERRYFVLHNQGATPLAKRTSKDDPDNTLPEKALFISTHTGSTTYLRKLLGKPI
jgi:hypothetical protein